MDVRLDWEGPFLPTTFLDQAEPNPSAGVYLWRADFPGETWIEYVGKASGSPSLGQRQQQHVTNTIGLLYTIPSQARVSDEDWVPGKYPNNKEDLLDGARRNSLIEDAMRYLDLMRFYLAPIKNVDGKTLALIERNLLWALQPRSTKPGTMTPPPTPVTIEHANATWLRGNLKNAFKTVPIVT